MKFKRLMSILLSMIMAVSLLAGCGGNSVSVTEPVPQEVVKVQGPAMWLNDDNVFEIYERTAESGVSQQKYWTNLPYESHSKSMLSYYIETHLLEEAGMTLFQQDEIELEGQMFSMLFFTHPKAEVIPETDYCLMLLFWEADGGGTEVLIKYSDSVTLEEWDATVQAESEPESEPKSAQSKDPAVLPDFLAHDSSGEYQLLDESRPDKAIYQADTIDAAYVAEAYVELLKEQGYTVVSEDIITYATDNDETFKWFLSHVSVDADNVLDDSPGQVFVKLNVYDTSNKSVVSVSFSEGITMEDYGSGESSSDVSTGGGYVDCPSCSGGNCTACNGSKGEYSYSPGLEREWEECWKCRGNGKCSKCDGFGKIFG